MPPVSKRRQRQRDIAAAMLRKVRARRAMNINVNTPDVDAEPSTGTESAAIEPIEPINSVQSPGVLVQTDPEVRKRSYQEGIRRLAASTGLIVEDNIVNNVDVHDDDADNAEDAAEEEDSDATILLTSSQQPEQYAEAARDTSNAPQETSLRVVMIPLF